jgi:hypothetical protein
MTTLHRTPRWFWLGLLTAAAVFALSGWTAAPARAAPKSEGAVELVPDDAAFYCAMLRNRQQWEAVVQSRAWAKLKALPVVQMGLGLYATQSMIDPDSVPAQIEAVLRNPEVKKALDLAGDMVSNEVFLYGGQGTSDFIDLCQQVVGAMRYGPAMMQLSGKAGSMPADKLQETVIVSALCQNASLIKAPDLVFGFRVTNRELARRELDRLADVLQKVLADKPELKERLKKTTIDGHEYLTLSLDGGMLPWDQGIADDLRDLDSQPGDVDKLVARLKETTLVVAVGLRDDYLLVSIGPSTAALERLGHGPSLRGRPELAPLAKFADKPLVSLAYLSKSMAARLKGSKSDIDQVLKAVDDFLPLAKLPEDAEQEIRKDAAALAADLKRLVPEPGAMFALGFLVPGGSESYSYDWSENAELDASKPLWLLEHVGGSPILAVVNRTKVSVENYDLLAKWLRVGYRYAEKYALPLVPRAQRAKVEQLLSRAVPLMRELDETNRKMLLPSLADGQVGFVLDTKLTSKRYLANLPATEKALPMLEPALVFGVSDRELLEKAVARYWKIANGLVDAVREVQEDAIPADFKIPAAAKSKIPGGTMYAYALPAQWGVDAKILPNAGLSDHVAVLSISRAHTERLLRSAPPVVGGRSLPADRPLALAGGFDFAGLIDAVIPWVDMVFDRAAAERPPEQIELIRQQVRTVLDVLKVFRNVTFEAYREGSAVVVHSRAEMKDVE